MWKNLQNIFILLLLTISATCQSKLEDNLALHKSYILSAPPNYKLSAPASDKVSLTDGIFTKGHFWTKKTTVGWQDKKEVQITIDLKQSSPIEEVRFSTAGGTSGVHFPMNLFVFTSTNEDDWSYVGDALERSEMQYGKYQKETLTLSNIHREARYVTLVIIPNQKFVFCDEIEIIKDNTGKLDHTENNIPASRLLEFTDSLRGAYAQADGLQEVLKNLSAEMKKNLRLENSKPVTEDPGAKDKWSQLNQNNKVFGIRFGQYLNKKYQRDFVVEWKSAWDSLSVWHQPNNTSNSDKFDFLIPVNGTQYGAFTITNTSSEEQNFTLSFKGENTKMAWLQFFVAYFAATNKTYQVADPLVPVSGALRIPAGESRLIFFQIHGVKEGIVNSSILMTNNKDEKGFELSFKIVVQGPSLPKERFALNTNVWAYLNNPMIKDRKTEAVNDLYEHHINTIVIPPSFIQTNLKSRDFSTTVEYINHFKEVENILLFVNYKSNKRKNGSYDGGIYMNDEWKKNFKSWYTELINTIQKNGFSSSNIYFYPYDEVSGKDKGELKKLILWADRQFPEMKFYASLTEEQAVRELAPILDIAQVNLNGKIDWNNLRDLNNNKTQIWAYQNTSDSRAASPYQFYRLKSWRAFAEDYQGIGFWNYAYEGTGRYSLNEIGKINLPPGINYSAIYSDLVHGKLISSRRWEAFKLGVEDYEILKIYAERFGLPKAEEIAQKVLLEPENFEKADQARREMLNELIN